MHKNLKLFLLVFLALLVLAMGGAWYAISTINPAQLTQLLSSSVKAATGRDLKIAGPVSLTIFPSVGVKAEDVSLSNAAWALGSDMIKLKQIDIGIRLLPLLSRRIEISRINLNGLDAHLQSNAEGQSNWVLAAPLTQGVPANANTDKSESAAPSNGDDSFVSIENVSVTDARISYQNGSGLQNIFEVQHLSLSGGGDKTAIQLDMKHANYSLGVSGKVTSIRKILNSWNASPLKINIDLDIALNGKSLLVRGDFHKTRHQLVSFDITLKSKSFDLTSLVAGSALAVSDGKIPRTASKLKGQSKYFFNEDHLPFNLLPMANGKVKVDIAQLGLPDQEPIRDLRATFTFSDDHINMQDFSFELGNGRAQGNVSLDKFRSAAPNLSIDGFAKGFTIEQILADAKSKVSGGDTKIAFDVKSSGVSMHQLASRANGKIQISVGQAKLATSFLNKGGDFVVTVLDAVNPLRKKSNQTVLECAVAYLPINNGLVSVVDTIGVETDRLDVVLNGSVNLNNEEINLKIFPREKSGLTLGIDLGNLIKLQGTLQNPSSGINQAGVVNSAVTIGLGFLTGGATILAENAKSLATKSQPCKTALRPWSDITAGAN
jgi:uncharacterized protein involved in outer membrane biogenesis